MGIYARVCFMCKQLFFPARLTGYATVGKKEHKFPSVLVLTGPLHHIILQCLDFQRHTVPKVETFLSQLYSSESHLFCQRQKSKQDWNTLSLHSLVSTWKQRRNCSCGLFVQGKTVMTCRQLDRCWPYWVWKGYHRYSKPSAIALLCFLDRYSGAAVLGIWSVLVASVGQRRAGQLSSHL